MSSVCNSLDINGSAKWIHRSLKVDQVSLLSVLLDLLKSVLLKAVVTPNHVSDSMAAKVALTHEDPLRVDVDQCRMEGRATGVVNNCLSLEELGEDALQTGAVWMSLSGIDRVTFQNCHLILLSPGNQIIVVIPICGGNVDRRGDIGNTVVLIVSVDEGSS